jgi:GST-like protein
MIELYTAATPNGRKASIMLEELGLPYTLHALDLKKGDQHKPEFLAINPNGKIPAIVDHDAAMMFQMSAVGPMFGQLNHFAMSASEKIPYAIDRYRKESLRIFGVLEGRLAHHAYLAGDYSIADVCTYPWVATVIDRIEDTAGLAHVRAWLARVGARPEVERGMKVP